MEGGVWTKAEVLKAFQCGVGVIPGEERNHESDDGDDQRQVFHQRFLSTWQAECSGDLRIRQGNAVAPISNGRDLNRWSL